MTSGMSAVPSHVPGGEFTVGVEEELMLVDDRDELMGAAAAPLVDAMSQTVPDAGVVTGEIYVDQVELNTPVCRSAEDAWRSLRDLRALVDKQGGRTSPRGCTRPRPSGSPTSPRHLVTTASSTSTPACCARRPRPCRCTSGCPTSARRCWPTADCATGCRCCAPSPRDRRTGTAGLGSGHGPGGHHPLLPPHHDAAAAAVLGRLRRAHGGADGRGRGVRPHLRVVGDAATAGAGDPRGAGDGRPAVAVTVAALTALVQGIARRAVESPDEVDLEDDVLAVNDHRAARYGLDTRVVDVDRSLRPLREIAGRVVAEARSVLAADRMDAPLDALDAALAGETGAEPPTPGRRGGWHAALLADLVARTSDLDG